MYSQFRKRHFFDDLTRVQSTFAEVVFMPFATAVGSSLFGASLLHAIVVAIIIPPLLYMTCLSVWKRCVALIRQKGYHKIPGVTLEAWTYKMSDTYRNIRNNLCVCFTVIVSIVLQEYTVVFVIIFVCLATHEEFGCHKVILSTHLNIISYEKKSLQRQQARKEWQAFLRTPDGMKLCETDLTITAENLKKFVDKCKSKKQECRDDVELSNYTEPVKPTLGDHLGKPRLASEDIIHADSCKCTGLVSEDITHADSCKCFKCGVKRAYDDIPAADF